MNKVVIGLGSNIEPQENIQKAKDLLTKHFNLINTSEFIQTKPIGYTEQDDFINGSVYVETDLGIDELTSKLKEFEIQLGRKKSDIKFGPRTIDLDIIVFNNDIIDKDFYNREFLKNSVLELIPDLHY